MAGKVWTLTRMTEEQERLLKETESKMGGNVLLAFKEGQVTPGDLTPEQMQRLNELEQKLGIVVLAVRPAA